MDLATFAPAYLSKSQAAGVCKNARIGGPDDSIERDPVKEHLVKELPVKEGLPGGGPPIISKDGVPKDPFDRLWQAVLSRNGRFDGAFVYGVRSTGIFCRPSCPSRRPGQQQVVFYPQYQEAQKAGFRSCLRCQPCRPPAPNPQVEMVSRVCRHIHDVSKNQEGPPSLSQLAQTAGVSPGRLHRMFKELLGITPRQYADACRLDSFKEHIRDGWDVAGVMYQAGYGSSSRLYQGAAAGLGMKPASYRRGGKGARITHNIADSPLGRLLVAVTEHGVCAVKLGDNDAQLVSSLHGEFPAAQFQGDDGTLLEWTQTILNHLQGSPLNRALGLELPLDIRATAFQRQVWEYLTSIPYGETRSYQEVAQALDKPRASRAVGTACAANPVALVIPCHRVVRQDGGMGGYRWGIFRKEQLLAQERHAPERHAQERHE